MDATVEESFSTATTLNIVEELPKDDDVDGDEGGESAAADPKYPITVLYCSVCTLPAELHELHSSSQFEK